MIIKYVLMIISFAIAFGSFKMMRKDDISNNEIIVSIIMAFIQINILIYVWGWLK